MFGDIFKKYFNFQGFYIVYIINWRFLGWKKFTLSKLGKTGLQKLQKGESLFGETPLKISHGLNFAPKIIPRVIWMNVVEWWMFMWMFVYLTLLQLQLLLNVCRSMNEWLFKKYCCTIVYEFMVNILNII